MENVQKTGRKPDYMAIVACVVLLGLAAWLQWTEPDYTKIPTDAEWEEMLRQAGKE